MNGYDPQKIKIQIQTEASIHKRFGPGSILSFLLREVFNNNYQKAREFMVSDQGGFEPSEVDRLINEKLSHKDNYMERFGSSGNDFSYN